MPRQKKTLAELVEVLDDGTTLYDILRGLGWVQREKERLKQKDKKKSERMKAEKSKAPVASPTSETPESPENTSPEETG